MIKICTVVGARPNFMKMAPVILELNRRGVQQYSVHTGQHYDAQMSTVFFDELGMPKPDAFLGVGSCSHAEQTARIMVSFEKLCLEQKPTLVVVAGDVNSTLACALVAAKLHIPVAHVESGLRSFDRSMPEEINRIVTDHLSSILFTTEPSGNVNLLKEGISSSQIHFVGNTMIDSLMAHLDRALAGKPWQRFHLEPDSYGLVTLHRPANVDDLSTLTEISLALQKVSSDLPLLFPVHPRTRDRLKQALPDWSSITIIEPLGYLDFLALMANARLVLTDSGGIQEETTILGVPCVTIRPNTERPITIESGTNRLAGVTREGIIGAASDALSQKSLHTVSPTLWDGKAAGRIVDMIEKELGDS
ncbi:non-hydrolyzing UDP-N-acetylglucosamine 2-epimerase [Candidatus Nitrospira neomarina]|uniref:UDP-N-acetylglucosamine 2-epimerase (Non-hydrolyzing) n=1 Tax=Candidatus Nitrospira neomarina TaxID=3020899 RepID=A0AA96GFU2_9BACT|nr:UDP-N-acetylglucosamine 2-epimerase (non-hydrolyzing) [Candidatus Nitrospira neomarina]WNM60272.1 UDP-N-acetylglucosamine 2-epimerase (non-hydrolyzing) [Candidatus Nitrospira neomarina]